MAGQQQDYLLRQIELLGLFVARLRRRNGPPTAKDEADLNEALLLAMHLQEKNFGKPAAEFLLLSADDQVAALKSGASKSAGHERCLTYATILKDTAALYDFRHSEDLALGARHLALHVALSVALDQPGDPMFVRTLVGDLRRAFGDAPLHAPTRELLARFEQLTAQNRP